jgi:hypothetical protein
MNRTYRAHVGLAEVARGAAGMIASVLLGCSSSSPSPVVADARPDQPADVSSDVSIGADGYIIHTFCIDPAPGELIDDMSGSSISLTLPTCGRRGAWGLTLWGDDTKAPGIITVPEQKPSMSMYSPLPDGFPGASADDGGAPGRRAMCIAGQTSAVLYAGAGASILLADEYWAPRALIDASAYGGIAFWLWVSPDTAASTSDAFFVQIIDKNQVPGGGTCDPASTGPTTCAGASAAIQTTANVQSSFSGPLFADDGSVVTGLIRGWQHLRAPWSSFVPNPAWGGANEQALDPRTLAEIDFLVQKFSSGGPGIAFNYCIYLLSFLPNSEIPVPGASNGDGGAGPM